jgi:hypothetical protein
MGAQVALALVLLVTSGLMLRSFQKMRALDPGFDASSAITFRLGLPRTDYPDRTAMSAAHSAIVERLRTLPGVTGASAATCLPLSGRGYCFGIPVFVEGRVYAPGAIPPIVAVRTVASEYLETSGMRLVRGRRLERTDQERGDPPAVVNQAFADAFFQKGDPLGQRSGSAWWVRSRQRLSASRPTRRP